MLNIMHIIPIQNLKYGVNPTNMSVTTTSATYTPYRGNRTVNLLPASCKLLPMPHSEIQEKTQNIMY